MTKRLTEHGYLRVEQVAEPGEFAVRGAVFDVFPTGSPAPVRDRSLRRRDRDAADVRCADAALGRAKTDRIEILPAREFPFDEAAIKFFRERFREHFPVEPGRCPIYRTISDAQLPAGIEYYLPLFFKATASLFDYLRPDTLFVVGRRRARRARHVVAAHRRALRAAPRRHRAADLAARAGVLPPRRAARPPRRSGSTLTLTPHASPERRPTPASRIRSRRASPRPTTASSAGSAPRTASARCS